MQISFFSFFLFLLLLKFFISFFFFPFFIDPCLVFDISKREGQSQTPFTSCFQLLSDSKRIKIKLSKINNIHNFYIRLPYIEGMKWIDLWSFYHTRNYSNSMQQDSLLQRANTLDLLVAVFPGKVVSFSLSPFLYPSRTSIITFFWLILKSGCLFLSSIPGCVLHGFTRPSVSVLFLPLGRFISVTVCRSPSFSCFRASYSRYRAIPRYFYIFIAIETASLRPQWKWLDTQLMGYE